MFTRTLQNTPVPWLLLVVLLIGPNSIAMAGDRADTLDRAWRLVDQGRYSEAEAVLRGRNADSVAPITDDCATALEIIRRIRLDYSLTPSAMLDKLRYYVPDASTADLERWRRAGKLQHRIIDGEVRYFKREPHNLWRFCAEARERRTPRVEPTGFDFDLADHVARLVEIAEHADNPLIHPVKHRVRYELRVKADHPRVKPGAKVRCWLPFPQQYRQQQAVKLLSIDPPSAIVAPNGHPQRTVCFEQTIGETADAPRFAAEFEFITSAYVPALDAAKVEAYDVDAALYREYTAERPPHIVFTPGLKKTVRAVVEKEPNPLQRARRIFRWVDEHLVDCSEMEYSIIPNISDKALTTRRGDCGVQSLLFITMCRAAGIPARWQSGWKSLPNGRNRHAWAEFYVEPWGWLPATPSYGVQKHSDPRVQEFFCGRMDAYRMIVNLDYGRELHPPKTSFRSECNDFQRGEIEIDGHNLYFDEWEWSYDVDTLPLDGRLASVEEALQAVVPKLLAAGNIPGAIIGVGQKTGDGYETWQRTYGFAQTEPQRVPLQSNAIFDMASMTKPIATGTSLMILIDQGRVRLEDLVGKYLPEFAEGTKNDITVHQLMTHMSGMPAYVGASRQAVIKEGAGFPCPDATRAYIRSLEPARGPGEAVGYSCLNAILCAEIVEAVTGQPLNRFAAQNIFKPLGMANTGFNPPAALRTRCVPTTRAKHAGSADGLLRGHVHDPLAAMQAGVSGNAGLFSTATDLSRFAQMMLNGGELNGVRILRPEAVDAMTRIQNPGAKNTKGHVDRRGLLWDLYPPDAGDTGVDALFAYGHNGYTGTAIRFYPEQGFYVIALTNRIHPDDSGKVSKFRQQVWKTVGRVLAVDVSTNRTP